VTKKMSIAEEREAILRDLMQHASEVCDHTRESFNRGVIKLAARARLSLKSATVPNDAEAVYYRYRHSEQEKWHYGPTPQNWWECQPLGVIAAAAPSVEQESCPTCHGNDLDLPCAFPEGGKRGCPRDIRLASAASTSVNVAHPLSLMLNAFRVTETEGDTDPSKQRFHMRFTFRSLEELHKADDQWRAFAQEAK
jgi:hypothetical protein